VYETPKLERFGSFRELTLQSKVNPPLDPLIVGGGNSDGLPARS
jgi:hypothetical protein